MDTKRRIKRGNVASGEGEFRRRRRSPGETLLAVDLMKLLLAFWKDESWKNDTKFGIFYFALEF